MMSDVTKHIETDENAIRVLVLDDVPTDAELVVRELERAGIDCAARIVDSKDTFAEQLEAFKPDIVLSDYAMPGFDGMQALELLKESYPAIPLIIVTGSLNEETAVECMKRGAVDYVLKEHSTRIGPSVIGALEKKRLREEKNAADLTIQAAALNWQTTFDSISDAVCLFDTEKRITHCNQAMKTMLGKPLEEIVGHTCCEQIHNHECPTDDCPFERARLSRNREDEVFKVDDNVLCITVYPVMGEDGTATGGVHIISDITKQKHDEDELISLHHLVDQSEDSLYIIDPQTSRLLDVNVKSCNELGYSRDALLKLRLIDFSIEITSMSAWQTLVLKLREKESMLIVSGHKRKDGTTYPVEVNAKFIKHHDVEYIVAVARNITERLNSEKDKEALKDRLVQAQKMEAIGTLAGGVAHDFNNILGLILGYGGLAKDELPPGSPSAKYLKQVLEAGERAKSLVRQILAFSRQSQVERFPMKIQYLIREGLKMIRSSIPTTIDITQDIDPKCGVVLADPTQIHQILINLCTNAYHAMEETGGTLTVTLKNAVIGPDAQDAPVHIIPDDYIELTVSDTGIGIKPDVIERIFEPYFTTKETGKGTGMGLAIIQGIMADCGGSITVESELGKGTTFHMYFPSIEKDVLPETIVPEDIPKGNERILFIDDEELLGWLGKSMLEKLGYHVTVQSSSVQALTLFRDAPGEFDLVITDQTMPNMTGSKIAALMLQIRPDLPIILCSGYSSLMDEISAKKIGIREFVLKPLTKGMLAKLVRNVLDA